MGVFQLPVGYGISHSRDVDHPLSMASFFGRTANGVVPALDQSFLNHLTDLLVIIILHGSFHFYPRANADQVARAKVNERIVVDQYDPHVPPPKNKAL